MNDNAYMIDVIKARTRVLGLDNELGNHALHTNSSKYDNIVQCSEKRSHDYKLHNGRIKGDTVYFKLV